MTNWTQRLAQKARNAPAVARRRTEPGLYDLSVRLRFWISPRQVQQWAAATKLFFVLGMGRSGTALLAQLLDQDPHAYVCHEPVRRDFRAGAEARTDSQRAEHYVGSFRGKEIFLRARAHGSPIYGEINSALRHHVYALMTLFPDATYLHLVRDGRAVVRSMMVRATLTEADPYTAALQPPPGDPWHDAWPQMDHFARLCWYWQAENAFVRQAIGVTIRFEDLLSDYDYFDANLLRPCGVSISQEQWAAAVARPQNQTTRHALAEPAAWSPAQNATFLAICADEMRASGYPIGD